MENMEIEVDEKATKSFYKVILDNADKFIPVISALFLSSINAHKKTINLNDLENAIDSRNQSLIDEVIGFTKLFDRFGKINDVIKKIAFKTSEDTYKMLNVKTSVKETYVFRFVNEYSATKVKNIGFETQRAIRDVLNESFKGNLTTREAARSIKQFIGLDDRRYFALLKYESALYKEGYSEAEIKKLVAKQRDIYLHQRSLVIARTETMSASNFGNVASYKDMVQRGIINPDKYEMAWMITPDDRLCEKCLLMKNETAKIGGNFFNRSAKNLKYEHVFLAYPPLHPQCRCTTYLTKI